MAPKNPKQTIEKKTHSQVVTNLKVGPLTATFAGGNITSVWFQGVEVLRGISYLARDENWGTCPTTITTPQIKTTGRRSELSFKGESRNGQQLLHFHAAITLVARKLTFTVTATPQHDFSTNRTGFVVLHPIAGVAGKPLTVTHIDGGAEKARFPKLISPGQPFFNIRALEHAPVPGLKAKVVMEGNTFEMEDQRNWGDASYKTYVCSLLDPWPYVLKEQESFTQSVTVTLIGNVKRKKTTKDSGRIGPLRANGRMPELGLSLSEQDAEATLKNIDKLTHLAPHFLLGLFECGKTNASTVSTFAAIAKQSGIPFRSEIVLSATRSAMDELEEVATAFRNFGLATEAVVITQAHDLKSFQPTDKRPCGPSFEDMAKAARTNFPKAQIGGGMISFFTELNRKRPPENLFDFITHSICPIVHDASDAAVMQTLETLPHIFASARKLIGDIPYCLGPTTIAARMNPYGQNTAANPNYERVCLASCDPRQDESFAAVWTLGVIAEASKAGLSSLCFGTFCGPRGVLDDTGHPRPIYHLLKELIPAQGQPIHGAVERGRILLAKGKQQHSLWLGNTRNAAIIASRNGVRATVKPYQLLELPAAG